jgi:hypothetical protein
VANEKLWKALWKITAPGKMKIHVWRFVHDSLPSGVQLWKCQVPETDPCIFCGRMESSVHALLTCQFARVVWREVKQHIHLTVDRKSLMTNRQWLFDFLSRASELQTTTLAVSFCIYGKRYVTNVSIIFDAPCLFYTNFLCFVYTSWHFYIFSETNLLTRCHSASSYFLLFLCFRKVTQEIFSQFDKTKTEVPIYLKGRQSPEERRSRTWRRPHHRVARATPGRATRWCGPLVHLLTSLFRL